MVKLALQCMQLNRPGNISRLGRKGNELWGYQFDELCEDGWQQPCVQDAQNTADIHALEWESEFLLSWHEVDV